MIRRYGFALVILLLLATVWSAWSDVSVQPGRYPIYTDGTNVGIGSAEPQAKLAVTGGSGASSGAGTDGILHVTTGTGGLTDEKLQIGVVDGSYSWLQAVKAGTGYRNLVLEPSGGNVMIGDTTNANITVGLTINQQANDNQILALKSSDVATGLTTAPLTLDVETDDYLVIGKLDALLGGATLIVLGEDGGAAGANFQIAVYGGTPETADTTTSLGLMNIFIAEHDGSNALANAPANANLFTIQSQSAGAQTTRLLLKGDDGELHLGNTTLVALDHHDDVQLIRAFERVRSNGAGIFFSRWDDNRYDKASLQRIGVLSADDPTRPESGNLMSVQGLMRLQNGAIWQLYISQREQGEDLYARFADLERENRILRVRLDILEQEGHYARIVAW